MIRALRSVERMQLRNPGRGLDVSWVTGHPGRERLSRGPMPTNLVREGSLLMVAEDVLGRGVCRGFGLGRCPGKGRS